MHRLHSRGTKSKPVEYPNPAWPRSIETLQSCLHVQPGHPGTLFQSATSKANVRTALDDCSVRTVPINHTMSTSLAAEGTNLSAKAPVTGQEALQDPTAAAGRGPVFPLSQNSLQDVVKYSRTFGSQTSIISKVNLPAGSHFCHVTTQIPVPTTTWSTVQSSRTTHFELNSALVYSNHSCMPTLHLEVFEPDAHGNYPGASLPSTG